MLVKVKTVTSGDLELTSLEPNDSVAQLKAAVEAKGSLPVLSQRVVFAGKQLEDEKTLEACGIEDGATVHVILQGFRG